MEVDQPEKSDDNSFVQDVVQEAFGDQLYTEHVKITLKNSDSLRMSASFPCDEPSVSTFKRTYFGATVPKSFSMDENLKADSTNQGRPDRKIDHMHFEILNFCWRLFTLMLNLADSVSRKMFSSRASIGSSQYTLLTQ